MINRVCEQCMRRAIALPLAALVLNAAAVAQVEDWPGVFNPFAFHQLNLEMDPNDWITIQNDTTYELEVPALFWADGEPQLLVAVRHKRSIPYTENPLFMKISLKIDINEYIVGQTWHGLHKLSLEMGDEQDVVSEGLAWYCHRLASGSIGYGYEAGLANWVNVTINGTNTGVYVSQEQRDKQWLRNRDLYTPQQTWLYKKSDIGPPTLEVAPDGDPPPHSPTHLALCYSPFRSPGDCPTPDPATLAAELPTSINMRGMLTLGAVNAFVANPDEMFNHEKNFWFADFGAGPTRLYLPWDLDSSMPGGGMDASIYGDNTPYETVILGNPTFRAQYSQILNDLICGPLAAANVTAFLTALEPILTPALEADLNNQMGGSVAGHFDSVRNWYAQRVANVTSQIEGYQPCGQTGDLDGDGDVDLGDLALLLANFGCPSNCPGDVDGDDDTDLSDLAMLLANFGT